VTTRRRSRQAFTLLELTVTIFLITLVVAFTLPQITSAMTLGNEQQAKASVNGAMDAIVAAYGRGGASRPWDTSQNPSRPQAPETSAALIRNQSPDVRVTPTSTDFSTGNNQVSASAYLITDAAGQTWWRVGVASWSGGSNPTCWIGWRDLDAPASSTAPNEAFYYLDLSSSFSDPTQWQPYCNGKVAARLPWIPPADPSQAATGRTWATPRLMDDPAVVISAYNSAN